MQPHNRCSSYLLYCIYHGNGEGPVEGLTGVQGQNVETVSACGMCAAVSAFTGTAATARIADIKRYGQVVTACHQSHTTIPMRFGAVFKDKTSIAAHLQGQIRSYEALLLKLTDSEEMGVRLLLPESQVPQVADRESSAKKVTGLHEARPHVSPGQAYLERQKARYGLADAMVKRAEKAICQWREQFKGLYVDSRWEQPDRSATGKPSMLSIYFLVRRHGIANFKRAFISISQQRQEKALLSGPWPPYNFVKQEKPEGFPP